MRLSVSTGWQFWVFVWSSLFWNESVLAQNYTKKFCQETLSFVSMSLQIFPNKFDVRQQDPASVLRNQSTFPSTAGPGLPGGAGFGSCQGAGSRTARALCHGPHKTVYGCFRGTPYDTVTTLCFDEILINFLDYLNSSNEGHYMCAVCLYCCLIVNNNKGFAPTIGIYNL